MRKLPHVLIAVEGGALPDYGASQAVRGIYPAGTTVGPAPSPSATSTPAAAGASPIATPSATPSGAVNNGGPAIAITAFPAQGGLSAISGTVTGLANPAGYWAILYVQAANGNWWIKPTNDNDYTALNGSGTFSINWASNPSVSCLLRSISSYKHLLSCRRTSMCWLSSCTSSQPALLS